MVSPRQLCKNCAISATIAAKVPKHLNKNKKKLAFDGNKSRACSVVDL
jgi:hypothetical protein